MILLFITLVFGEPIQCIFFFHCIVDLCKQIVLVGISNGSSYLGFLLVYEFNQQNKVKINKNSQLFKITLSIQCIQLNVLLMMKKKKKNYITMPVSDSMTVAI